MTDLVLQHTPSSSFGSVVAILAWYVGRCINDITMLVSLGKAESQQQQKGIRVMSGAPSVLQAKSNPMQATRTQMWMDLLRAGIIKIKLMENQMLTY